MDNRKYITEVDILYKNSRIDIILEALELIMNKDIASAEAINIISERWSLEKDKILRLMTDIIIGQINAGVLD